MTQQEKRIWLIQYLLKENPEYENLKIPEDEIQQKQLLRSLMNIRAPKPIADQFLNIQDSYLSEVIRQRGVTDCKTLKPVASDSRLYIWRGDITSLKADAIVNAANSALLGCFHPCHSCIDNIIHTLAGIELRLRCNEIMEAQGHEEPTGQAKITPGYNLPCRYVLHTVGPIVHGVLKESDRKLLASCYASCLKLADLHGCESIAFCCISTGVFHFPQEEAAKTAIKAVREFLKDNHSIKQVIFNVFTEKDLAIYENLLGSGRSIS